MHLKGFAPSLAEAMLHYRVCLAPLRFGAGLKGKIVDSWWCGWLLALMLLACVAEFKGARPPPLSLPSSLLIPLPALPWCS